MVVVEETEVVVVPVAVIEVRVWVVAVAVVEVELHCAPHITKQCSRAKSPSSPLGSLQSDFGMREPQAGASRWPWHLPGT